MIEVHGLTKFYADFCAVKQVTFSAKKGDIVGFLGPNGAGKTSTIRMLSTFMPPTSGTASVAGYDILEAADEVRKRIGYLPETPPLYGELTVTEYLNFVARIKGIPRALVKTRVGESIERCFLTDVSKKLCHHLSKGYRQRVGLAQAIIHNPDVMILDEPTSGLDPKQIIEIRRLISSLAEEHTVILSTHILQEVSTICNKVVIIAGGVVTAEGYLTDLLKNKTLEQLFLDSVTADKVPHQIEQEVA